VASPVLAAPPYDTAAPVPLAPDLVRAVQGYVLNFAKTGDPNGEGLPAWPTYTTGTDQHMVFDADPRVATAFSRTHCDAWDAANAGAPY
jgi:para-nitrobenzyl esterase